MKILHVGLTAGFLLTGFVGTVRADDNLRRYQQSLRDQGFYYGPIDGNPGDETTQALRRYQIRNGLSVTGQLDADTRRSIDHNATDAAQQSTPPPLATPPPVRRLPTPPPTPAFTPPPPPPPRSNPRQDSPDDNRDPRPNPPPRDDAPDGRPHVTPSAGLTNYFGGTAYEFAPPPVQTDILRIAQRVLSRSGFYDGEADGRPSHELAEAVSNFQEVRRLRRSGRLDTDTLAALGLSPDRRNGPPRRDPNGGDPRNNGQVYDGRIIH